MNCVCLCARVFHTVKLIIGKFWKTISLSFFLSLSLTSSLPFPLPTQKVTQENTVKLLVGCDQPGSLVSIKYAFKFSVEFQIQVVIHPKKHTIANTALTIEMCTNKLSPSAVTAGQIWLTSLSVLSLARSVSRAQSFRYKRGNSLLNKKLKRVSTVSIADNRHMFELFTQVKDSIMKSRDAAGGKLMGERLDKSWRQHEFK